MNTVNNFTFIVLTYNHANYILEHLESIKYLVMNYGNGIAVDLIVADDASRDDTIRLAAYWLKENSHLFGKATIQSDGINRGTCKNLTRAIECLTTDYCKITAGDDMYSYENIFVAAKKVDGMDIISGLPLNLIDGVINNAGFDIFNLFATNIVYEKSPYLKRLKGIGFFNSPSVIYSVPALLNKEVLEFVNLFSVTEDYPLQIKIAELYRPLKFAQIDKIFVYYRRTAGSAYLIKNTEFSRDKKDILRYLMGVDSGVLSRFLLANRLFCFDLKNRYLKLILNLNIYVYAIRILLNARKTIAKFFGFDAEPARHQAHYDFIRSKAAECNCNAAQN